MDSQKALALALDPSLILAAQGIMRHPWQCELLLSSAREILLNCCRQSGKLEFFLIQSRHHRLRMVHDISGGRRTR